jgi:HK97 family phage portal protein
MAIVVSGGALFSPDMAWSPSASYGSMRLYDTFYYDYATLYRTQPNVRTCVDFLARNIAQLGLHVFRRVSDTDRQRLTDHPLAQLLARPLPPAMKVTRYRLIESLVADLGVYFNAYWLKVRAPGGALGLLRVPPPYVLVEGGLVPTSYTLELGRESRTLGPEEIVHFRGYNADSCVSGLSPLETLRRVLAEEHAAGEYRESFWQNSARIHGLIERPAEAPEWSETARERFRAEFAGLYSGSGNSGKTGILEEGMTWKPASFNPQEAEYLGGRKLTREECARAYHIPLPMVGILDHATFSNIREQHKNLYQDCLGPWLAMIEGDVDLQLVPEFEDTQGVYCEFNIAEKLQGSFEEQTQSLQAAVGRPWMTANEARARANLPSMGGDADELVTPLNVLVGGQASPQDSAPDAAPKGVPGRKAAAPLDTSLPKLRTRHEAKWAEVLGRFFRRQERVLASRAGTAGASIEGIWSDGERWDRELYEDMYRLNVATATVWARYVAGQADVKLDEERLLPWLSENARIAAREVNATTLAQLADALLDGDALEGLQHVYEIAQSSRAQQIAASKVTGASNFGAQEGAKQAGFRTKTWVVNSSNPRSEHAAMAGETVGMGERFSNGQLWPGDPAGGADNNAGCQCGIAFGR